MNHKKAFTLIELLVVIAIIAILAAILFPVFAQAKLAAKKTADLSNMKQIGLSALMYSNDADDSLGDSPNDGPATEAYVIAARLLPYIKSRGLFKAPSSPYMQGTVQRKQHDNTIGDFMTPPSDPCVGLGTSIYGTTADANNDHYFVDIYPPTDYMNNPNLWSYKGGGCLSGGTTGGYAHPGPNLTSGTNGPANNDWNGASATFTSVSKAILYIDSPTDNQWWPGSFISNFWGSSFQGLYGSSSNAVFVDGHAKSYQQGALEPAGQNMENTQGSYDPSRPNSGTFWYFWGLSDAAPNYQ